MTTARTVNILIEDKDLRKLCLDKKLQTKTLGGPGAKKLRARLADLDAAYVVTDLVAGRPHPLERDRAGQFAVSLDGGRRLVFEPGEEPVPLADNGVVDWGRVRSVRIVFIGNYHD